MRITALARRVHQNNGNIANACNFKRAIIIPQRRNIVNHRRASANRALHDRGFARIDRNSSPCPRQSADERFHAREFIAFPHKWRAGTGGFTANVDNRSPRTRHRKCCFGGHVYVNILPTVGEAIGRGVNDAHHVRLIQPDGPRAHLQGWPGRSDALE